MGWAMVRVSGDDAAEIARRRPSHADDAHASRLTTALRIDDVSIRKRDVDGRNKRQHAPQGELQMAVQQGGGGLLDDLERETDLVRVVRRRRLVEHGVAAERRPREMEREWTSYQWASRRENEYRKTADDHAE